MAARATTFSFLDEWNVPDSSLRLRAVLLLRCAGEQRQLEPSSKLLLLSNPGAVLARAGRDTQIIALTCMPERYRYVGGATVCV